MTRIDCPRCGAQVVRAASGRLACTTPTCAGPALAEPTRKPITPDDFANWPGPYVPPSHAGEQDHEDDGRWWVT